MREDPWTRNEAEQRAALCIVRQGSRPTQLLENTSAHWRLMTHGWIPMQSGKSPNLQFRGWCVMVENTVFTTKKIFKILFLEIYVVAQDIDQS